MTHGIKTSFEVVGENRLVEGASPPGQGFRFGRLFPDLPPFRPTSGSLLKLGEQMTKAAGPDGEIAAGYTYFGQFIDHDITRDAAGGTPAPSGNADFDPVQLRSPSLDLDSLYGGPGIRATLVDPDNPALLRVGSTGGIAPADSDPNDPVRGSFPNDLPRVEEGDKIGAPLIGDDRNDENLIVAQLHLAFIKFHNKVAGILGADEGAPAGPALMEVARKLVTRHYQWLVLNDFVRRLVDPAIYADVLRTGDLATPGHDHFELNPKVFAPSAYETPPMPLEFSVAAYRLGHSMIRNGYPWNRFFPGADDRRGATLIELFVFTNTSGFLGPNGPARLPSNWIVDWRHLFDFTGIIDAAAVAGIGPVPVKALDTSLAPTLAKLARAGGNLAFRNLDRGRHMGIPSAQTLGRRLVQLGAMKESDLLTAAQIADGNEAAGPLDDETRAVLCEHEFWSETPLWFYILREAALLGKGLHLGPLGSRIMLETFVGLIRCSVTSIFDGDCDHPGFQTVFSPERDSPLRTPAGAPLTTMAHLLAFVDDINPLGNFTPTPPPPDPLPESILQPQPLPTQRIV